MVASIAAINSASMTQRRTKGRRTCGEVADMIVWAYSGRTGTAIPTGERRYLIRSLLTRQSRGSRTSCATNWDGSKAAALPIAAALLLALLKSEGHLGGCCRRNGFRPLHGRLIAPMRLHPLDSRVIQALMAA